MLVSIVIGEIALDVIEVIQGLAEEISNVGIVHRIENLIAGAAGLDQANIAQVRQVMRHRRGRHACHLSQRVDASA